MGCAGSDHPLNSQSAPSALLVVAGGNSFEFGMVSVGHALEQSFLVTNLGEVRATGLSGAFQITAFQFLGGAYPGAGGTCGANLDPGFTCQVVVAFIPPYGARFEEPLRIRYFNGLTTTVTSRPIIGGTGVP